MLAALYNATGWTKVVLYTVALLLLWAFLRFIYLTIVGIFKSLRDDTTVRTVDPFINGVQYAVSYWTEKGGRPYQEDRHQEIRGLGAKDSSLYGVYDGHGGHRAAQFCRDNLLSNTIKDPFFLSSPAMALTNAFFRTDKEFSSFARLRMHTDGTTAVVAVIHDRRVFVANAGDSRGIIVQKGGRVRVMSIDHKPNREDEERRIRRLGGKVVHWGRWRVQGVLAVSRAIGDVALQPYVTCEPEILEKEIGPEDEYLVLASDGIWDVMRNEEVAQLLLCSKAGFVSFARELCHEAIMMGSTDNVTAVVIDLKDRIERPPSPPSPSLGLPPVVQ